MVICGITFLSSDLEYLSRLGVKDSKKLSPNKRKDLAYHLKQKCASCKITIVSVNEIDERINRKITLNRLEELKMADIIEHLRAEEVYIDAADVDEKRFGRSIHMLLNFSPELIVSEHKADEKYPIVSAASIVAKYERDAIIEQLKKEYGDFGSGYTSDSKTIDFLRQWIIEKRSIPFFARKSWETTKKLLEELLYNKKMTEYL
ncbi:MAG: ribonuclease HII [Promethearchaeota archaeon]|nr:MAG: ribonuclease HII [Candidatus Lokiarchaeota archaeon]